MVEKKTIKILLVEYDLEYLSRIQEMIERNVSFRFQVIHRRQFDEIMPCLDKGRFDLLVMDVFLPDDYIYETISDIHAKVPYMPILAIGDADDHPTFIEIVRHGARDYLLKSGLTEEVFCKSLSNLIEQSQMAMERQGMFGNRLMEVDLTKDSTSGEISPDQEETQTILPKSKHLARFFDKMEIGVRQEGGNQEGSKENPFVPIVPKGKFEGPGAPPIPNGEETKIATRFPLLPPCPKENVEETKIMEFKPEGGISGLVPHSVQNPGETKIWATKAEGRKSPSARLPLVPPGPKNSVGDTLLLPPKTKGRSSPPSAVSYSHTEKKSAELEVTLYSMEDDRTKRKTPLFPPEAKENIDETNILGSHARVLSKTPLKLPVLSAGDSLSLPRSKSETQPNPIVSTSESSQKEIQENEKSIHSEQKSVEEKKAAPKPLTRPSPKSNSFANDTERMAHAFETLDYIYVKIVVSLQELCPSLKLSRYFEKTLQLLDYELIMTKEGKTDEHQDRLYRFIFNLLEAEISKGPQRSSFLEAWIEVSKNPFKKEVLLSQYPCRIFYVFFRFLSLFLYHLKKEIDRNVKRKLARNILQILETAHVPSPLSKGRKCELQHIFKACRRNTLKKGISCPCEQSMGPQKNEETGKIVEERP